jgi:hypothetical protein
LKWVYRLEICLGGFVIGSGIATWCWDKTWPSSSLGVWMICVGAVITVLAVHLLLIEKG